MAVHARSLHAGFAWDDHSLIEANRSGLDGWDDALRAFREPLLGQRGAINYYRPVLMASFVADARLHGLEPRGFHATNVLLHGLNVMLVWGLLYAISGSRGWSQVGALLFGLHPLQTQAVSLLLGRNDLLLLPPIVASLLAYRAWRTRAGWPRAGWTGLLLALFGLVLWTKETGIVLPLLLLGYDLTLGRSPEPAVHSAPHPPTPTGRARLGLHLGLALVIVAYLVVRGHVLGTLTTRLPGPELATRLLRSVAILGYYVEKAVLPFQLSAAPFSREMANPASPAFLRAALFVAGVMGLTGALWLRQRRAALGPLLFLLTLAPVIGLVPMHVQILEHRTYVPLLGLALLVSTLPARGLAAPTGAPSRAAATISAAGLILLAALTWQRQPQFFDDLALWEHATRVAPDSVEAQLNHGHQLLRAKRPREALPHLRRALRLQPGNPVARADLDRVLTQLGIPPRRPPARARPPH